MSDCGSSVSVHASYDDVNKDFECARNFSAESSNVIEKYVSEKLTAIKNHNYKIKNVLRFAKYLRRKLHMQKKPTKKGYEKFFTNEEKR